MTSLEYAAQSGHKDVVKILLEHGATFNAKILTDRYWLLNTKIDKELLKLLLDHVADINVKDYSG